MNIFIYLIGLWAIAASAAGPSAKSCKKLSSSISYIKAETSHPLNFCTYYLSAKRTRSPLPKLGPTAVSNACACILKNAGKKQPKIGPAQAGSKISVACNTKYQAVVKREFKHPLKFCQFYGAIPRAQSFVKGMTPKQIAGGCKCFLSTPTTTKKSTKISKSSTSTKRSSTVTSKATTSTTNSSSLRPTSSTSSSSVPSSSSTISPSTSTESSSSSTIRQLAAPETATATASTPERYTRFFSGSGTIPRTRPPAYTLIPSVDSPFDAVQACANFAQAHSLASFFVALAGNTTITPDWFCGGWTIWITSTADWLIDSRAAEVYAYALPNAPPYVPSTTTTSASTTLAAETSVPTSTQSTVSSTTMSSSSSSTSSTSSSTSTTALTTTTTTTNPSCSSATSFIDVTVSNTGVAQNIYATFSQVYTGYGTTVTDVSTATMTTFTSTLAVNAVATSCASFVGKYQNYNYDASWQLYFSNQNSNWVCMLYYDLVETGAYNYGPGGASSGVGCVYGYEEIDHGYYDG